MQQDISSDMGSDVAVHGVPHRNAIVGAVLSLVPGLGQAYNRQPAKAVAFFLATFGTIVPAVLLLTGGESLGHTLLLRRAFVLFLLLAVLSIIGFLASFLIGLYMWASSAVDAYETARHVGSGSSQRWWFFRL